MKSLKKSILRWTLPPVIGYLMTRPTMDFLAGNETIHSRFFARSLVGLAEEEYQVGLDDYRIIVADVGNPFTLIIKLYTFPNDINYDDYKSK